MEPLAYLVASSLGLVEGKLFSFILVEKKTLHFSLCL